VPKISLQGSIVDIGSTVIPRRTIMFFNSNITSALNIGIYRVKVSSIATDFKNMSTTMRGLDVMRHIRAY